MPITRALTGRTRRTCSPACRQRRYRQRHLTLDIKEERVIRADHRRADRMLARIEKKHGRLDETPQFGSHSARDLVWFRLARNLENDSCRTCGKPVMNRTGIGLGRIYCSKRCYSVGKNLWKRIGHATHINHLGRVYNVWEYDRLRIPWSLGMCKHCKIPFSRYPNAHRPRLYCSKACRQAAWYRRKHGPVFGRRKCAECHQVFAARQYSQIYCGRKCRQRFYDQKRDTPNLKTVLRTACVMCGAALPARNPMVGGWRRQTCSERCKSAQYSLRKAQKNAAKLGILPSFVTEQGVGNVEMSEALR